MPDICQSILCVLKLAVVTVGIQLMFLPTWAPAATAVVPEDSISLIESLWHRGEHNAAHAVIDSLLPVSRAESDTLLTGRLLVLRGMMHTAIGDGGQGEAPLREGLKLVRAAGDPEWEMTALRWFGVACTQNLKDDEAGRAFVALLDLAQVQGNQEQQAWAETGLAYQALRAGDLPAARSGYTRAVLLFKEADDARGELFALNGLGNVLNGMSDYDAARRCYRETLATSRRIDATFTEALAANNLGTLDFSLGDPGEALANFRRAYELQMQDDNLREAINAAHNIAVCLTYLGEYDRSLDVLDEAVRICREHGYRELEYAALTQRGLVLTQQNRLVSAEAVFSDLLTWTEPMPDKRILDMVLGYATMLGQQDRHAESLELLMQHAPAARMLTNAVPRLAYLVRLGQQLNRTGRPRQAVVPLLAVAAAADSLQLSDPLLLALTEAGAAYNALDKPDSAVTFYRRAAAVWERERRVPLDPQWRERRGVAGQAIYTELAALVLGGADSSVVPSDRVDQAYELLQNFKARTLLERMSGPGGTQPTEAGITRLNELQQVLKIGDEVLLDFFTGYRRSYLFVVTRQALSVRELPAAAELKQRIGLYCDLVLALDPGSVNGSLLDTATRAVWELLLQPAERELVNHRAVVYCPDDELNRLPLALLLQTAVPGEQPHVVQRTPSASVLVRLRRSGSREPFPVRHLLAVTGVEKSGDGALAAAGREVAWLDQHFAGVATGLPDTVPAASALAGFDLIHLASHMRVSDEFPWRSTIFARTADDQERILRAAEIARSRLGAGLTVLAGCESAGGRVVGGEGVMGLSSAFIAAGSPTVLASLWPADDVATYRFMRAFYGGLAAGATVADACHSAQMKLAGQTGFQAPRLWAGFVVIGDGNRRLVLTLRHGLAVWQVLLLAGVILMLGAVILFRVRAKGRFL